MSHSDHHGEWKWLGDGSLRAQDADEGLGHIVPIPVFNKVFGALVVLTVITVAASRVDFGELNTVIAIFIASIKAFLVAYFFMHLKFEKKIIIMYAVYPLVILFLLIGGSLGDVSDREHPIPFWKEHADLLAKPAPEMHGHGDASHGSPNAAGTDAHGKDNSHGHAGQKAEQQAPAAH